MTRPAEPHAARRHVLLAVKIAVSLALLTILFSRIDASRLWATARQASIKAGDSFLLFMQFQEGPDRHPVAR